MNAACAASPVLPLRKDSQWENHRLSLTACPGTQKLQRGLVWGPNHPGPGHLAVQSRHALAPARCGGVVSGSGFGGRGFGSQAAMVEAPLQ